MKLYSGPLSLFSAKARIALGEKNVAHELVQVGWSRRTAYVPHHPEVVALNPKRQVPVLVDGELVVYDSTLIFEYLEERVPRPALYPSDLAERARCRQQEAAADEIWFPHVWTLIGARVYGTASDESSVAAATSALGDLHRELDRRLDGRAYFSGEFSVADIGTFIMAYVAETLGAPVPADLTRTREWMERVGARPAVRRVIADMSEAAALAFRE
jgi:glutathione S-transferase